VMPLQFGSVDGILKLIVFGPGVAVLESRIACRSEPAPLSLVFVTVKAFALRVWTSAKPQTHRINLRAFTGT